MSRLRIPALLNHSSGSKSNARIIPLAVFTLIKLFPFLAALLRDRFGQAEEEAQWDWARTPGVFDVRSFLSPQNQEQRARSCPGFSNPAKPQIHRALTGAAPRAARWAVETLR